MTVPGKVPLVSIILPTYNQSEHLADAVSSILCQTFTGFELIIVDDGSTDTTGKVLGGFSDPRIFVIRHPENSGLAKAYNSGLAVSRGEYLGFIGSDDRWLPEKLEEEIGCFSNLSPEFGVVYSDMWEIDPAGNRSYWHSPEISGPELFRPGDSDYQVFCLGNGPSLIRRSVIDRAGGFDERFRAFADLDLFIRLTQVCRFCHIRKPLYVYRSHRGTSSDLIESSRSRLLLLTKYPESVLNRDFFRQQCMIIRNNLQLAGEENRRLQQEIADAAERYGTPGRGFRSADDDNGMRFWEEIGTYRRRLGESENSITVNILRCIDRTLISRLCPPGSERSQIYHRRLDAIRKRLNPLIRSRIGYRFKKGNS